MPHPSISTLNFLPRQASEVVATIGFFDGVHLGHRYLLEQVKIEAEKRRMDTMAVTFSQHPREVLSVGYKPELLTSYEEKLARLQTTGINSCGVLQFSAAMAQLTAKEFMQHILKEQFNVSVLLLGHDHSFGSDKPASLAAFQTIGRETGIEVVRAKAFKKSDFIVSSSSIRRLLQAGNVADAALCLGSPYEISGSVVQGHQVGSQLGFPTANLRPESANKLIPRDGVYAVQAFLEDKTYGGMLNIGCRPTLNNGEDKSIEAHLFGVSEKLYGKHLTLRFCQRIRDERHFPSKEALKAQLCRDADAAKGILGI